MQTADVMIHLDETIDHRRRTAIAASLRAEQGVAGVSHHDEKPHLMIVQFDPGATTAQNLLKAVRDQGIHAELVGL